MNPKTEAEVVLMVFEDECQNGLEIIDYILKCEYSISDSHKIGIISFINNSLRKSLMMNKKFLRERNNAAAAAQLDPIDKKSEEV